MFDKNHLGHDLKQTSQHSAVYTCNKCKSTIWANNVVYFEINTGYKKLISCDEIIIKNIIE